MNEIKARQACGDNRFDLIAKAREILVDRTNIEMRQDEMAVLDSILFRCWQMGWLDQLRDDGLNPDCLPNGLLISDDGTLLNWRGENYVKQAMFTLEQAALNKAAGNWAHVDNLLRGLLEECDSCPDTGCTQYIEKVVKPNMRSVDA